MPCEWMEYKDLIVSKSEMMYTVNENGDKIDHAGIPITHSHIQKCLYQNFIYMKYRHLDKGNWVPISECIIVGIQSLFPDKAHSYMGYKSKEFSKLYPSIFSKYITNIVTVKNDPITLLCLLESMLGLPKKKPKQSTIFDLYQYVKRIHMNPWRI